MSHHAKRYMRGYFKCVIRFSLSLSLSELKSPVRLFPKYSVREGIAKTPCPIWNRLLTLTSSKNRDPTAWNGSRSYHDVLGKLLRRQYNEWCQYREKTFQSFYARRHELINVAFMFYIVDGIAKSPTHVTKFDYPAEMTDGLQSFDRKRFRHGVFAGIYSDMRWKKRR